MHSRYSHVLEFEASIAMDAVVARISNLESAQSRCFDELFAIQQQWIAQMELMTGKHALLLN